MRHFTKELHPGTGTEGLFADPSISDRLLKKYVGLWNRYDRNYISLSVEGEECGIKIAERLPEFVAQFGIPMQRIFVSPYQRTLETARIVAAWFPGIEMIIRHELVELDAGVRSVGTFEEVCARFPEFGREAHEAFLDACPPYGESHSKARDGRVRAFLQELPQYDGGSFVITHAGIIECMHQLVYGTSDEEVVAKLAENRSCRYGSILAIGYDRTTNCIEPIIDDHCLFEPSS